jgi:hypothetical protein
MEQSNPKGVEMFSIRGCGTAKYPCFRMIHVDGLAPWRRHESSGIAAI